jgi:uncharacterized protein (DUF1330 family)
VPAAANLCCNPAEQAPRRRSCPVYVIAEVDVTNPEAMAKEFSAKTQPVVRAAGGRYLAAGSKTLALEGDPPKRVVLHVWNSMDDVKRWWNSDESKNLRAIGAKYGKYRVFAIEGSEQ